MKVLMVHNYYKQRGGEDESFESEVEILRSFGHEVVTYTRHNDEIDSMSQAKVALDTLWNRRTVRDLKKIFAGFNADVMHCTNLFPLISPSAYKAANDIGVPVVQSLRNYRHMCLNSFFFREGSICERCKTKRIALPGIRRGCYKENRIGSTVLAAHNGLHKTIKTWHKRVDRFFTPTAFAREKYIEAGFPAERLSVKPNFLFPDPGTSGNEREFGLFVGRLAPEKGLLTLIETWVKLDLKIPLKIVGSGILKKQVVAAAAKHEYIHYEGILPLEQVKEVVGRAKFLVMPSEWYETFGRTIMEAFSRGTPVIASNIGAMAELIQDGRNGLSFSPGNGTELGSKIMELVGNEDRRAKMGLSARNSYDQNYTAAANHECLLNIFKDACQEHQRRQPT